MNPVLTLSRNNLDLTKRCLASIHAQQIPAESYIVDNGSTDGTGEWASNSATITTLLPSNLGVSQGWNLGLRDLFVNYKAEHVLVIGNDTVLGPWSYRWLLSFNLPFVSGVAVDKMAEIIEPHETYYGLDPHPDFSCFLIRRDCWEAVGQFDERMKHYCSDCDYHIRAHRIGVPLYKVCVPFFHERSSTMRLAPPQEKQEIAAQAEKDRAVFRSIYGCVPGDSEYEKLFI